MKINLFFILLTLFSCQKNEKMENKTIDNKKIDNVTIVTAPSKTSDGQIKGIFYGCGYNYIVNENNLILKASLPREINQIETILNFTGLSQNFEVYSAPIKNALATNINGKRYILYDPQLLSVADKNSNFYWSSMSILAHEIGHHLQGHTLDNAGSTHERELEADKFSGHILFKMGATLEQSINAIVNFGSDHDTDTHPSKTKRIQSISEGWNNASKQRYESAIPPPPSDDKTFTSRDYYIDEFSTTELLSEKALTHFKGYYINGNEPLVEGIILNVDEDDPTGGSWSEDFSDNTDPISLVYTIQITDNSQFSSEEKQYNKINQRKQYFIPDLYGGNIGSAQASWLRSLMVPGRKIAFKSTYYGWGTENLIYIKKLVR